MKNFYLFLAILLNTINLIHAQTKKCLNEDSCAYKDYGTNYTNFECDGFESCKGLVSTSVDNFINCYGSQSCMSITSPYLDAGTLNCYGYESCMKSNLRTDGNLYCYGEKSCFKSDVAVRQDKDESIQYYFNTIDCRGVLSCALSTLTTKFYTNQIYVSIAAYGMFSLYDSVINSTNSQLSLYLYGYYAGYNATIYCGSSADYNCTIECFGNGCYNTKLVCFNDAFCGVTCDESQGISCPANVTYIGSSGSDVDLYDLSNYEIEYASDGVTVTIEKYADLNNTNNVCLNETVMQTTGLGYYRLCNDYKSCYNTTIYDNNNQSICCQATYSCELAQLTTPTLTYTNSQNRINAMIRCDAMESCDGTTIIANNSIDCGAFRSCIRAALDTADNIRCSGSYSCLKASIAASKRLICGSDWSCYNSDVSGVSTVLSFGYHALDEATIRSDKTGSVMNIYFCSYLSGYDSKICCYEGDTCNVYCASDDACLNVKFSSDAGCGNSSTVSFHYNYTVSKEVCQVYQPAPTMAPSVMPTMMPNVTGSEYSSTALNTMSSTDMENTESTSALSWNDSSAFESSFFVTDINGSDIGNVGTTEDDGSSGGKGGTSNKNASSGLTTAVIIIATLVVLAIVGLGVYYYIRSRSKSGGNDEQKYQLLDKDQGKL